MDDVKKRRTIDDANGGAVATTTRKRGRPAKLNKPPAKPPSGRGRGRPPKNAKKNNDDSDGATATNGEKVSTGKRGRPRKSGGKQKTTHQIVATGKGRGRPKSATTSDIEQSDDNENDSVGS